MPDPFDRFRLATPRSAALFERALRALPHGVTRDPVWREPYPLYIDHGSGAHVEDVDGRRYLDWWNNATALVLGHADPRVVAAVGRAAERGLSFAGPTQGEIELAERLIQRLPSAERVRFTNSGSEAVMLALQIARAASGRPGVVKFEGAYHGGYDPVAVSVTTPIGAVGPVEAPTAAPEGTGVSRNAMRDTVVVPWNDLDAVAAVLAEHGAELGAILVEPVANKQGVLTPGPGYLEGLRRLADHHGVVLIFDEVISFRVSAGGAQAHYGVAPDLTTLGKVIGGGMPVGAVAGRWDVMQHLRRGAPDGVGHMGTFNANPMTLAAGAATLEALDDQAYAHLSSLGAYARERLRAAIAAAEVPWQVTGLASLFKVHLRARTLLRYRDTLPRPKSQELELVTRLALAGHLMPYNAAGAVTLPMQARDVDALSDALYDAAVAMREAGTADVDAPWASDADASVGPSPARAAERPPEHAR